MVVNKSMVTAGICTLLQASGQMIFTTLGITQHFCVIDFLKELPLLLYIRILYFHNPSGCGTRINIGQSIDSIADQAFVLLTREPFTAFRTFIINCTSLGLSVLWIMTSVILIMGGAKNMQSKHVRWPWILVTVAQCGVDVVATVTYANDSFHTRTLSDAMDFIGGSVSGISNVELNTTWAAWTMALLYSRLVVFFILNILFTITLVVGCNARTYSKTTTSVQVEAPPPERGPDLISVAAVTPAQSQAQTQTPSQAQTQTDATAPVSLPEERESSDLADVEESSTPSAYRAAGRIPRAGLSQSFRKMKAFLFRKSPTLEQRSRSHPESLDVSPERSPRPQHVEVGDKKRAVNFPESLLSLPQRLENMIAEQQRRLDRAVIDTAGRQSPPRTSQSLPHLDSTTLTDARGRRGTTAELQGQLPWAYIPASAHPMRDQLPPDEDLPPVPLPDYTAIPSFRKASVHRAASSLSSLTQKKDYASHSTRPPLTQSDVLY